MVLLRLSEVQIAPGNRYHPARRQSALRESAMSASSPNDILVDRQDGIVSVTLNRPDRLNAVSRPMWTELARIFEEIAGRPEDRVVVLTGAGRAFCSGADLTSQEGGGGHPVSLMRQVGRTALALHELPKPTIARVDGLAVGAGLCMAVGCDLVVASDRARFSAIFSKRALSVDFGGSWLLPRLVGLQRAKELVLFADMIDAEEAQRLGLVNRVTTVADLDQTVKEWADRLVEGPQLAMASSKRLLNRGLEQTMEQALEAESYAQVVNMTGPDMAEAVTAFQEKRRPTFGGSL
jgi:2-(1,2-epoxy-1,2-dihydrophenyl)acetyl-CoA isomerase